MTTRSEMASEASVAFEAFASIATPLLPVIRPEPGFPPAQLNEVAVGTIIADRPYRDLTEGEQHERLVRST